MITVVSGLPRSGTSLMMQMLKAGGLPLLCDEDRPPDAHNPRGYFEFRKVRSLERDSSWLEEAEGKAVKIVSPLLLHLPRQFEYRVLFLRRNLAEVLNSQAAMLATRGQPSGPGDEAMRTHFLRHLTQINDFLRSRSEIRVLDCDHASIVGTPETVSRTVAAFLERDLDPSAMARVVDPVLHRQKEKGGS